MKGSIFKSAADYLRHIGRKGGKAAGGVKAEAARANGKKGGRPAATRATYPRKPSMANERRRTIKATANGAVHYVGRSGTGGAARKMRRQIERAQG